MSELLKKQKFGVEVEFTGITRTMAAEAVAEILGSHATGPDRTCYRTYTIRDSKRRIWKVMRDSSICPVRKAGRELMDDFKKGCGKSEAELDVAYKILNPSPVGGFVDSLVKMDKDYSTNLWEIKRKQIKSFIPECDGYQLDDIVAYCRAKFFKEEVDRIIYDNSIAEECDVCVYADGTILSPEWPYLCAKVYVSIKWIDENKTTYTRIFPSAVGFMSYKTKGSMEDDLKQKENMSTMEMREHLKISRAEFSRRYNIPIRTLENWESGKSKCPDYVRQLLERAVLEDSK